MGSLYSDLTVNNPKQFNIMRSYNSKEAITLGKSLRVFNCKMTEGAILSPYGHLVSKIIYRLKSEK